MFEAKLEIFEATFEISEAKFWIFGKSKFQKLKIVESQFKTNQQTFKINYFDLFLSFFLHCFL